MPARLLFRRFLLEQLVYFIKFYTVKNTNPLRIGVLVAEGVLPIGIVVATPKYTHLQAAVLLYLLGYLGIVVVVHQVIASGQVHALLQQVLAYAECCLFLAAVIDTHMQVF